MVVKQVILSPVKGIFQFRAVITYFIPLNKIFTKKKINLGKAIRWGATTLGEITSRRWRTNKAIMIARRSASQSTSGEGAVARMHGCRGHWTYFLQRGRVAWHDPQGEGVHIHLTGYESSWSFREARIFFAEPGFARNWVEGNIRFCNKWTPLREVSVGSV